VWWRIQHGVPTPVGLAMTSWREEELDGPRSPLPEPTDDVAFPRLDGVLLRKLPIGAIAELTRERIGDAYGKYAAWLGDESWEPTESMRDLARRHGAVGDAFKAGRTKRDLGEDHYREVAQVYAAAVRTGKPTQAVAEHFQVAKSSAAKKVARARVKGFLPATQRGRVGRLTEEL